MPLPPLELLSYSSVTYLPTNPHATELVFRRLPTPHLHSPTSPWSYGASLPSPTYSPSALLSPTYPQ